MKNKENEEKEDVQVFNPEFLIIPRLAMKLPVSDRFVFGAVYVYSQLSKKKCTASNVEIGRVAGVSPGAVANSLIRLENAGLIKRNFKDESKRNRESIVSLVGFGKLDSSQVATPIHPPMIRVSSTNEQIKNNIKNIINTTTEPEVQGKTFNSKEYFTNLVSSSNRALSIIAYYTLKRGNFRNVSSQAQANAVIARNIKVAKRLEVFEKGKIRNTIDECENTIIGGRPMFYTLETVENFLLK